MKQNIIAVLVALSGIFSASAQIGYQVAVVDQTTGEPKINTSVNVTVTITDNADAEITKITQTATTNDFGVVSLLVGNESTFAETNWDNLPLWISATVDGVSLGKTQILNVPIAEYAKRTGQLTVEKLVGTWTAPSKEPHTITFHPSGNFTEVETDHGIAESWHGTYEINGDFVITLSSSGSFEMNYYSPKSGNLYRIDGSETCFSK